MNEHKKTMLILDANESSQAIISNIFEQEYLVLLPTQYEEVNKMLSDILINIIVCVINDKEEIKYISKVKEYLHNKRIPIIVVLEDSTISEKELASYNIDDWISNPLDLVLLKHKVNNLVMRNNSFNEPFSAIDDKPFGTKENLFRMMKHIPGSIIMYYWDGYHLKTVAVSDYYIKKQKNLSGGATFKNVHPDDIEGLQKAAIHALKYSHKLNYLYRSWDEEQYRYLWKRVNAIIENINDQGCAYAYAFYTDVTKEMDAKIEAEKNHEILKASIAASGQFTFEFDPRTDIMICPREQAKIFDLPADYIDFPESLFAAGGILEEARPVAKELMDKLHHGVLEAECELKMYTKGEYLWYRFCFHAWDDPTKGYPIYLCSFTNINNQKVAEEKYLQQLEIISKANVDSLAFSHINVTKNICEGATTRFNYIKQLQRDGLGRLDFSFEQAVKKIPDEEKEKFISLFNIDNLMKMFNEGKNHISLQHRFEISTNKYEWIETVVDMVQNPNTGDIEGYVGARNINVEKVEELILREVIEKDYRALIYFDRYQDEYMIFDSVNNLYFENRNFVYRDGVELGISLATEETKEKLRDELTKEKVIQTLSQNKEISYFYDSVDHHRRYQLTISNVPGDDRLVIGALRDVTDDKLLHQLKYESEHDSLTGFYNREKSFLACNKLIEEHPLVKFTMVHFDIQKFRLYNSFFGEREGDRLLKYISKMFEELNKTHEYGVYGRIEADVFLLFFPYKEGIIEWNQKYIHDYLLKYRDDFQIAGNCGIYVTTEKKCSVQTMFNYATLAAKNNINKLTNPICFFDTNMAKALEIERDIAKEMRIAIEKEQFKIYLQPKFILSSGEPYGAEVLVRWEHPTKGIITPNHFIPLFESNGFITTLDQYMWEHTCILIKKWLDKGIEVCPISINISRVSMYSPQIVEHLIDLIHKYDIPFELFNLELTESAYMDNPAEMKERLIQLRKAGFKIMMDDFGSGYSSLNTLRNIPIDYLKVDRGFLATIDQDKRSRLVLASVIRMASRMGIPVITEGVETDEQREFLIGIGCDYVQGFLFAKPMSVFDYEDRILNKNIIVTPKKNDENIYASRVTMNMDTQVQNFADLIPHAIAFIEYVGNEFAYLNANKLFQTTFGMQKDIDDMNELLKYHISEKNYGLLTDMYRKIAENHCSNECFISWRDKQNHTMYYLVRAQYLGKSSNSTVMITTFIDLTEFGKNNSIITESAKKYLLEKNIYTMSEINRYLSLLNQSFGIARLVRPEKTEVITTDAHNKPICIPGKCYSFWGKHEKCKKCSTLECIKTHESRYKIEKRDNDYYLIASHPISIDIGNEEPVHDYAIETLTRLTDETLNTLSTTNHTINNKKILNYERLIYEDPLTMVYNRRYFQDMKFLDGESQPLDYGIAFVMIDLDGFKIINDQYGHMVGDQILVQTAVSLQKRLRKNDVVIRYGGDEFLVIIKNTTKEDVILKIKGLHSAISEIRCVNNQELSIDASIGYAFRQRFTGRVSEALTMINEADKHMYNQKKIK